MHKSFDHRRHENAKVRKIARIMDGLENTYRPVHQLVNRILLNPWKDEDDYKINLMKRMDKRVLKEQMDLVAYQEEQRAEWDAYLNSVVDSFWQRRVSKCECSCYCQDCIDSGWCGGCWCFCDERRADAGDTDGDSQPQRFTRFA